MDLPVAGDTRSDPLRRTVVVASSCHAFHVDEGGAHRARGCLALLAS